MKFSQSLSRTYKWWKYTDNEKHVRFKPETPLRLKDSVSSTSQQYNNNACLQEMFVMMACLKKNEFDQASCTEEISKYNRCNTNYFASREQKRQNERAGSLVPGEKHLSPSQVNTLLRRFPPK